MLSQAELETEGPVSAIIFGLPPTPSPLTLFGSHLYRGQSLASQMRLLLEFAVCFAWAINPLESSNYTIDSYGFSLQCATWNHMGNQPTVIQQSHHGFLWIAPWMCCLNTHQQSIHWHPAITSMWLCDVESYGFLCIAPSMCCLNTHQQSIQQLHRAFSHEGRLWNFGGTHQIHKRFLSESSGEDKPKGWRWKSEIMWWGSTYLSFDGHW